MWLMAQTPKSCYDSLRLSILNSNLSSQNVAQNAHLTASNGLRCLCRDYFNMGSRLRCFVEKSNANRWFFHICSNKFLSQKFRQQKRSFLCLWKFARFFFFVFHATNWYNWTAATLFAKWFADQISHRIDFISVDDSHRRLSKSFFKTVSFVFLFVELKSHFHVWVWCRSWDKPKRSFMCAGNFLDLFAFLQFRVCFLYFIRKSNKMYFFKIFSVEIALLFRIVSAMKW